MLLIFQGSAATNYR